MNTGPHLNIRDAALLIGCGEPDSPARINCALYAPSGWALLGLAMDGVTEVWTRPAIKYRERVLYPTFIRHPQFAWHQPFYRSTGRSMPSAAPAGSIWPISGIYTDAYCARRGYEPAEVGYIGKHYFRPDRRRWVNHSNDLTRVWPFLVEVADMLALGRQTPETGVLAVATA